MYTLHVSSNILLACSEQKETKNHELWNFFWNDIQYFHDINIIVNIPVCSDEYETITNVVQLFLAEWVNMRCTFAMAAPLGSMNAPCHSSRAQAFDVAEAETISH